MDAFAQSHPPLQKSSLFWPWLGILKAKLAVTLTQNHKFCTTHHDTPFGMRTMLSFITIQLLADYNVSKLAPNRLQCVKTCSNHTTVCQNLHQTCYSVSKLAPNMLQRVKTCTKHATACQNLYQTCYSVSKLAPNRLQMSKLAPNTLQHVKTCTKQTTTCQNLCQTDYNISSWYD